MPTETLIDQPLDTAKSLLPLLRSLCAGDYGIALGGAHAKGVDDSRSDLDLYVFAREVPANAQRDRFCRQFADSIHGVTSWGDDARFIQGGTDFYLAGLKVEVWFRQVDYIAGVIAECQQGIVKHDFVTWTVMGFFNHCTLSDLHEMMVLEDPAGMLAAWQAQIAEYPPALRQRILADYLGAALFWPDNFHYKSAVERGDLIYTAGIAQQVINNLIQVLFAYNRVYFPGEKKLAAALDHLPVKPGDFTRRVQRILFPQAAPDTDLLAWQRAELARLVDEVRALVG